MDKNEAFSVIYQVINSGVQLTGQQWAVVNEALVVLGQAIDYKPVKSDKQEESFEDLERPVKRK